VSEKPNRGGTNDPKHTWNAPELKATLCFQRPTWHGALDYQARRKMGKLQNNTCCVIITTKNT
jgi:hypothetical protein